MFFSTDLLSKRHQSGFGLYWLAATVANSKSTITKLSKKELLTADLQKACTTLAHPPEPLALRLTSGLLLGITRVYGQQWSLFYLDVQHASQSIRKAFSTIVEEIDLPAQHGSKSHHGGNKDINLPGDTVRLDAITLTRKRGDLVEELMDFESMDPFSISDLNEDLEIELGRGLGNTRIIPFTEDGNEADSRSIDLNQQKRPRTDRFVSRPEDINLVELEPIQLRNDFIDNQDMWIDNPSFQGGLEVDAFDVGEGLLAGINPELDADFGITPDLSSQSNPASLIPQGPRPVQLSPRGLNQSVRGSVIDPLQDVNIPLDDEEMRPPPVPVRPESVRSHLDDHPLFPESDDRNNLDEPLRGPNSQIPESFTNGTISEMNSRDAYMINQFQTKTRKRLHERSGIQNGKKKIKTVEPIEIVLSEKEIKEMKEGYKNQLEIRKKELNEIKRLKRSKEKANELLFGVPNSLQAPELVKLWNSCVKMPRGHESTHAKTRFEIRDDIIPEDIEGREGIQEKSEAIALSRRERSRRTPLGGLSEQELEGQETGFEGEITSRAEFGFQTPWDDGQMESGTGLGEEENGRPVELYEDVIGRHRAQSVEGASSQTQAMTDMPWNRAIQNDQGIDYFEGHGSAIESSTGRSTRQFVGETPVKTRFGRQSSVVSSVRDSVVGMNTPLGRGREGEQIGENRAHSEVDIQLEQDSLNFLEWTKTQTNLMISLCWGHGLFLVSDLAPVTTTTGAVAAQAFHKILSLTTKNLVKVIEQDEPYGEIRLQVVRPH
ncbi:uncharacterized protein MELLADRAFT_93153 [Melampsora larici-populina 98AG31]|uniref:Rad21/Rec8-like protein N-terminal domain-containing protein n=2 Tax=Melampsora laricis-populina TaxID=203908 RepID=F4S4A0_MELLP|nr:uncharacterized protein MELLADRAFT_93153 [Melampsora larici-populina 98AG31]EGG00593.1 hypothetical protein MELLADRAFT_93153 [Melampsora larici-populina 98AG31]